MRGAAIAGAVVALVAGAAHASASGGGPQEIEPKLAFVRFAPPMARLRIVTRPVRAGHGRTLRLPPLDAQGPSWSPDGRSLAFVGGTRAPDGTYLATDVDLYVARASGRGARRLTRDPAREAAPVWSPDGRRLAYVRAALAANRSSLWTVSAGATGARRITSGPIDIQPSWSPDGRRIVFARITRSNESQIWEIAPDGTGARRLVPGLVGATQPTWSPDGSRLLLTDGSTLFTVRLDGSDRRFVTRLTTDSRGARVDPQPVWSRSGWIVFAQMRSGALERADIWRIRPDGARLERLTRSPGLDSEPSISP